MNSNPKLCERRMNARIRKLDGLRGSKSFRRRRRSDGQVVTLRRREKASGHVQVRVMVLPDQLSVVFMMGFFDCKTMHSGRGIFLRLR